MQAGKNKRDIWRIVLIVLFVGMCAASMVKVLGKVERGKTAFVRWMADTERLVRGEMVYSSKLEEYPHLPMMALILIPFHALGATGGSIAWLLVKCGAIAGILWAMARTARHAGKPFPSWALVVLFLLSVRVFAADLTHGNFNILIGGLIVASFVLSSDRHDFSAGVVMGLATIMKVTPGLFLVFFLYKRRWWSLVGAGVALVIFGWLIPSLFLGFRANFELTMAWYQQMVEPFAAGRPVWWMQTRYENQSLTGVFYRLLCDTVAIPESASRGYGELRINVLSMKQGTVATMLKAVYLGILGLLAWFARTPREARRHQGYLGEFAMVFLAMLFISERSWKHHYVLLILAHAFLLHYLLTAGATGWRRWVPTTFLSLGVLCHLGFSETLLGEHYSNVAEAYGVYVIGALCLFAGCAVVLAIFRQQGWTAVATRNSEVPLG